MRTVFNTKRYVVACILLVFFFLYCVDEYNPFDDNLNASSQIIRTSINSDTIPIFTTDSIEVMFTVCNLIKNVSIRTTKNRYFESRIIDDLCAKNGRCIIPVSFYDTGFQEIRVVTFRENGDSIILKKHYYVVSFLENGSINGEYGSALRLNAEANNTRQDKDIKYVWKIGSAKTIKSFYDTVTVVINELVKSDSGQLYVCDNLEKFSSPPVFFKVELSDAGPEIIVNPDNGDTLYTSDDVIELQVKIEKSITPGNVYVNDDAMDCSGSNFYVKTIRKNGSQIQKLTIVTVDRTEKQYSRVVYVVFNSDKQQIINPRIKILELLNDDGVMTVMQKNYTIEGIVEFYANRKVHYTVSLFEGNKFKDSSGITSDSSFKFYFPVALENVNTVFRVELADTQKNLVANTTLMINYCKECIDTVPPKIASVFVNNNALSSGDRFVSNKKDIRIELVFFDESGVDSVFINNTLAKRSEETSRRWYFDTVVNHITTPDTFSFYAVDKAGNHSPLKMVIAGYNTHPQIYACPDSIEHAFTGKLYISGIDIRDTDTNDFVTYTITDKKSSNIFIDEKGVIKWTPGKSDLGFHSVKIKGEDRSGFPVFYSYSIYVSDTILDTVRFVTSRNEFPILLPCTDTVNIQLKVHGGTKPFVFEINDRTKSRPIPVEKLNPFFRWKPECTSDLGSHQFFIVVRDTLRLSDTLWPVITVLPPNRPFEIIEQRWSGSLKTDSVLDLSKNRTDTLFYSIKDPDSSGYEQHTISVSIGTDKYSITADSGNFSIPLSHLVRTSGKDSLVLIVNDKGSHVKKISKQLDYGTPPVVPMLLNPHNDIIVESKDITFSWSSRDPDGEALKYHFTLQYIDGSFQVNKETQDTFYTVSGLKKSGVYHWSIAASDSKSSTNSLTGKIICLPYDRVRIDTTISKLPEMINCKTSIKVPIVIKNGYPPFTYKCSQPAVIDNDSLAWTGNCNKTGVFKINLLVEDSVGNTDSCTFNTSVYGSDSLDLKMVNSVPRNDQNEIDVSNPLMKTVVCTLAIIDPDPSPPENFIVEVLFGNHQQQYFNKYVDRTLIVSLKSDTSKIRDTLSVNVTDMNGNIRNLTEILYYGN